MRINANTELTAFDVLTAARNARVSHGQDIYIEQIATSPRGAITFYGESINGRYAANRRTGARAASWTAWGYLIADLYRRDPTAKIGQYKNVEDFRRQVVEAHVRFHSAARSRPGDAGDDISFLDILPEGS